MKQLVRRVMNGLTIDYNIMTLKDMENVLKVNHGYPDGNRGQLVVFGRI